MFLKSLMNIVQTAVRMFSSFNSYYLTTDNHYIIEAKTPETEGKLVVQFEGSAGMYPVSFSADTPLDMIRDDREKPKHLQENKEILGGMF